MPGRLQDKIAIVTGAGSRGAGVGNGKAASLLFSREGAKVCLVDNVLARAEETLAEITKEGGDAFAIEADVSKDADCKRVVDEAVRRYGRVDILHNNVGIDPGVVSVVDVDEPTWDQVMDVNVKSMMLMSKHAVPVMAANGGGAILTVSSISALRPRGLTPYTTSKQAVIGLTQAMAVDHASQGIRVNCIAPGPVFTPMVAEHMTPERRAIRAKASPLGTEGTAWDIGWAAVFLASEEARWITGQVLVVDGGTTLVGPSR
ncbi:MAG TPA: SDR family oxidoreductase [Dehalococcoidia bacterium]|jgi:NAD(P)-dependent dehydrogenase (short-subunit alcohol dehydrogenase family)|nr:SDR family oxidoreductase [Dehalococcoidia bacterium]